MPGNNSFPLRQALGHLVPLYIINLGRDGDAAGKNPGKPEAVRCSSPELSGAMATAFHCPFKGRTPLKKVLKFPSLRLPGKPIPAGLMGLANVTAGLLAEIDPFDASFAGLGGCPFLPGAAGNIATEDLVHLPLAGYV